MSGGPGLERGYRRPLACYPRGFRDEHGEELLAVLLAGSRGGQHRPGFLESVDLIRNGLGMRLRPDQSPSARQGWSDALAAYSLTGPVLLLLTTVPRTLLWPSVNPVAVMSLITIEAVIIASVLAGLRNTALAALAISVAVLGLGGSWFPGLSSIIVVNVWIGLSIFLLEAVALIASPGPRHGRRLVHWGHWAFVLVAAAAAQAYTGIALAVRGWLVAVGAMVILIVAVNRLGRGLRLSRYCRLLLAATFYPTVFLVFLAATPGPGGLRLITDLSDLGYPTALPLVFAGPLVCAAVALSTAIRPRRRRII